ncbi:MAG: site-specific DNA-methyltransferase [Actinobacteria bacterium]|nr:site-specific DNA-methyltransferase [Actinomycetota bacterium]
MILQGDCLEKLKELDDNSVDSIVTDPPYELGFMHKKWDSSGISYNVDLWKECLRVLKPGGHLLSFGGSRTYHRMACAIEDAGFEIRDMIEWVYGSGFPKSLNIGKKIDQLQGNEREEVLRNPYADGHIRKATGNIKKAKDNVKFLSEYKLKDGLRKDTKGSSEWEGWGTALKPAHEPIVVARKPLSEKTIAKNVLK